VSPIKSEPIKKHIGEVVHVDRAALAEEGFARRCLELLEERAVLVFPGLRLSDEEQLAFTDRMGARLPHYNKVPGAGGDIYKITLDPEVNDRPEYVQGTFFWHMDGLTSDAPPPKATLLSARRPATKGGQTEFASTVTAYESLPADDKKEIAGLRGVHSISAAIRGAFDYASKEERARLDAVAHVREHPLVWKQKSGRTSLVIGESADRIVDMPLANGRALLARLLEWTVQPDFVYRHAWQEGDLVMWHNYGVLHRVLPYDGASGRIMHRTSLAGTEVVQ
jgi:alpha-ketoglutarate-dependent taurine dioxygenase